MIEEYLNELNSSDKKIREQAIQSIVDIGPPAVEVLIEALGDQQFQVRSGAAIALGRIGDPRAIEPLIAAFKERRIFAREVTEALGQIGPPVLDAVTNMLDSPDELLRKQAIVTLGKIGNSRAMDHLITLLDSPVRELKLRAVAAVGSTKDERVVERLITFLESPDQDLKFGAAAVLGESSAVRAVEPLSKILDNCDPSERRQIAFALSKIGPQYVIPPLLALVEREENAWLLLELLTDLIDLRAVDPRITDALLKLLDSDNRDIRLNAADLLGRSRDPYAKVILEADARQIEVDRQEDAHSKATGELWASPIGEDASTQRIHERDPLPPRTPKTTDHELPSEPDIVHGDRGAFDPDAKLGGVADDVVSATDSTPRNRSRRAVTIKKSTQPPHFSAFYPESVQANKTYALMTFVHLEDVFKKIQEIAAGYADLMGGTPTHGSAQSRIRIPVNQLISFVPQIDGIKFDPVEQIVTWQPPYQSVNFVFTTPPTLNTSLNGRILVYHGPLLVGEIPVYMAWIPAEKSAQSTSQKSSVFQEYNPVFASYSHRDTPVMEYFRQSRQNMGVKMLVDIYDLRSGEHWADRLLEMINESAIFQLFWSRSSAESPYCRKEWEYALKLMDQRPRFIQPVWWETPMPDPPDNLAHLHFQKISLPSVTRMQLALAKARRMFRTGR